MKKLDNFSNCLTILRNADFKLADNNDIYRTGVIGQFLESASGDPATPRGRRSRHRFTERNPAAWL